MAFKDANGDALRGVIMAMSLYMPAKTSASQATNCGEQVVVFAFVFVAVRLTWQLVVRLAGPTSFHSPVHSPVLPPMEQTLYESKNVAVEGCPRAVVTDPTYLDSGRAAYSKELAVEDRKEDDSDYWKWLAIDAANSRSSVDSPLMCVSTSPSWISPDARAGAGAPLTRWKPRTRACLPFQSTSRFRPIGPRSNVTSYSRWRRARAAEPLEERRRVRARVAQRRGALRVEVRERDRAARVRAERRRRGRGARRRRRGRRRGRGRGRGVGRRRALGHRRRLW